MLLLSNDKITVAMEDEMVTNADVTSRIKLPMQQIAEFCRKFGVAEFSLFGSCCAMIFPQTAT